MPRDKQGLTIIWEQGEDRVEFNLRVEGSFHKIKEFIKMLASELFDSAKQKAVGA